MAQPEKLTLLDFFKRLPNSQFVIPVYQRNYIWGVNREIKKYIDDYEKILTGEKEKHFIGIIMYLNIERSIGFNELSVVDGQQRLVTTFLMMYALKKLAEESDKVKLAEQINEQYLVNKFVEEENDRLRLKPLVSDDNVFSKIIRNDFENITKEEKKTTVFMNYKKLKEVLTKLSGKYSLEELLNTLNKFYFVAIPLDNTDDPQKIFETINSAGKALSKSDLIRNYILMNVESTRQEKLYKDYWYPLEKRFESGKIENFFRMFLASQRYSLCNMEEVYEEFQDWYDEELKKNTDPDNIEVILKKIRRYADFYCEMYVGVATEQETELKDALEEFKKSKIEPAAPLLMEVFNLYKNGLVTTKSFVKIINLFNTYTIRRNICNQRTGILTRTVPLMLKHVIESCDGNYEDIYTHCVRYLVDESKDKQSFMPDDEYLKSNLKGINAYALRNYLKIIFEKIESYNNPAKISFDNLAIEHLMPQTPTEVWLKELNVDKEVYEYHLNRLGNLTLATPSDNSKMKNNPFNYKQEILKSTNHLKMNVEILEKEKWGIEEIEERTDKLIEKICKLYPYESVGGNVRQSYSIELNTEETEIKAKIYTDSTVEIMRGSKFKAQYTNEIQNCIDEEIIIEKDGMYEFLELYVFDNLEKATSFFAPNNSVDVWELWTDSIGDPLNLTIRLKLFKSK